MATKKEQRFATSFLPCMICMGLFMVSELWRHQQNCLIGPIGFKRPPKKQSKVQQEAKLVLPTAVFYFKNVTKGFYDNVLASMKINDESAIARKYTVIVICGTIILKKVGKKL